MGLETKQVYVCINKIFRSSVRKSYRLVSEHPVLFSLGILLYLLYISFPGFFAFILSSSPVIVCATLLLGILLSYGDTMFPEANENVKCTPELSAFKAGDSSRFEANHRILLPSDMNDTGNIKERATKLTIPVRQRSSEHVPLLPRVDDEDEKFEHWDMPKALTPFPSTINIRQEIGLEEDLHSNQERAPKDLYFMIEKADRHTSLFEDMYNKKDTSLFTISSSENGNKHVDMEENLNQERIILDLAASVDKDISQAESADGVDRTPTCDVSMRQGKRLDGLNMDTTKDVDDNPLDSSLGSPCARVGSEDGSSSFDSDRAESSSPDASMIDIAPVLDEIDPLLGGDSTRPDLVPMDDLDSDTHVPSQDHPTDDDSNDEDVNNDAKESDQENKKDDKIEAAIIWTTNDENNLMDLGYSEMERNRRLEILMVRRRSRKNIIFEINNNLIDVNDNDAGRNVDDLAHFRAQVPHISVTTRNPFDLPYDPGETAIPGSAPSILHSRKNPFDLLLEHSNDSAISAPHNLSPGEPVTTSHPDIFFRRHESFNFGSTGATQEKRMSRLEPYFVPETVEGSTSNFQRQFSDKSESKLTSVTESDMASSVTDQDDRKDIDEKDVLNEHEASALLRKDSDLADVGSECSDDINSVDVELDQNDIDECETALQHFVFERSQEREAYIASTIDKGNEKEDYILKSAGNSVMPFHPVADLLSWEDGDGESFLGARSSLQPNTTAGFSEWMSSPSPAEELESRSRDLGFCSTGTVKKDNSFGLISYSNNEIPLDNMIHGSTELLSDFVKKTFPEISRDLHPIPEERVVEHFNIQENHGTVVFTDSTTALTDSHAIEEHFDVGSEVSPSSTVASLCPPEENDSIQSPFFFTASVPNRVGMVDLEEETTGGYLLDSDGGEKIYPNPLEDNETDESFLSELDAVGDFGVAPMRLDHQVPDLGYHTDNPANDGGVEELSLYTETSDVSGVDVESEPLEGHEQLCVINAKYVNDICSAFEEHSSVDVDISLEQNKAKDGWGETSELTKHAELPEGTNVESMHAVGDDDREVKLIKTASSMSSTKAETLDDINAVF